MVIEENIKAIAKRTKLTGFGPNTEAEIRENARLDLPEFKITLNTKIVTEKGKVEDNAESNLYYVKNENGYYSLDSYDTRITTRPDDLRASAVVTVKMNNKFPQNNITLKEMCNLKLGGSVKKRISYSIKDDETGKWEVHNTVTWKKMSDTADENGNYSIKSHKFDDLAEKFQLTRAKELQNPERTEEILNSISKGNVEKITETYGETAIPKYIWVDVQFKTIDKSDINPRIYQPNNLQVDVKVADSIVQSNGLPTDGNENSKGKDLKVIPESTANVGKNQQIDNPNANPDTDIPSNNIFQKKLNEVQGPETNVKPEKLKAEKTEQKKSLNDKPVKSVGQKKKTKIRKKY